MLFLLLLLLLLLLRHDSYDSYDFSYFFFLSFGALVHTVSFTGFILSEPSRHQDNSSARGGMYKGGKGVLYKARFILLACIRA